LKAPLDSAAQSTHIHIETGKMKTWQVHTFVLRILLDLDDDASCFIQVETLQLIIVAL
jgi:hypothetical protein